MRFINHIAVTACVLSWLFYTNINSQVLLGSSPSDTLSCDVAVVGGGPGGVYSAYRLLETNSSLNVCLYEATHRVGGRVYSVRGLGPNNDLVLDMGAYRYMPLAQPLITEIIQDLLKLPNRLYQPGVPDYKIILNEGGSNAGFATYVEKLLTIAIEMGLQMNFNTEIVQLTKMNDGSFTLTSRDGRNVTAERVILNLPSRPLHRLLQNSIINYKFNEELYAFYQIRATKLYLYYPTAWWIANGLNNGSLAYNLPWNTSAPTVPIIGRYYDAQVKCPVMGGNGSVAASSVGSDTKFVDYYYVNSNSLNTQSCYGYIQATYTSDGGNTNISHYPLDYLVDYGSPTTGADGFALPYSVWDNTTSLGSKLLTDSHNQLMAYQASVNKAMPPAVQQAYPTQAVVALWDPSVTWSGGAWHSEKVVNASHAENVEQAIKPFDDLEIYVADEAYGTQLGWSEGSLVMAENLLRSYFGAEQPPWMTNTTAEAITFGPTYTDYENVQQMSPYTFHHIQSTGA